MAKQTQPRKRRTAGELFLDKLSKLTKGEQSLIANTTLREALGWDEKKYTAVRLQLRTDQLINVGQGRGGTVGLAKAPKCQSAQAVHLVQSRGRNL